MAVLDRVDDGMAERSRKGVLSGEVGETLSVPDGFEGRVTGDYVMVEADVVCACTIKAETVVVKGVVTGRVEAVKVDVDDGGAVSGEVHAQVLRVSGRLQGVARAASLLVRRGASVAGAVVTDRFGCEPDAAFDVCFLASGEDKYMDQDALRRARAAVAPPARVAISPPVAVAFTQAEAGLEPGEPWVEPKVETEVVAPPREAAIPRVPTVAEITLAMGQTTPPIDGHLRSRSPLFGPRGTKGPSARAPSEARERVALHVVASRSPEADMAALGGVDPSLMRGYWLQPLLSKGGRA